jgi:tetratricopeptide (TPR) repeat protein
MRGRIGLYAVAAAALILGAVFAQPVLAASGGGSMGGGSAPSGSTVDPAKAYQEGVAALNARDYRRAISKLRQVLDVAPNDPTTNYALGLAFIGDGQVRDARRPLERAVRGASPAADARKQLGLVYLQIGEREKAQEQLTALATELAACDAACGEQRKLQLQTAHDGLKQALDGAPAAPTTGWVLPGEAEGRAAYAEGVGLVNQARFGAALGAFIRARDAVGPHPDVLNYIGFVNRKLGRYDEARVHYEAALAIDPDHRGATEYLGELYLEMGLLPQAQRQLAKLDTLCPYGCAEREELARWIAGGR